MQLLSIGNSYSQDSHKWLHKLAAQNGVDCETVNLYMAGCNLSTHWNNVVEAFTDYEMEPNGNACEGKIGIIQALSLKKWDIITLQQASHQSGKYDTYQPYLASLVSLIREMQPDAKLYFHQTWAYEIDSDHPGFVNYQNDQKEMYRSILDASAKAAQSMDGILIPVGKVIQTLRETVPEFDYANGGLSLCRDGFHLSLDYGRFAAAATWLHTITGQKIETDGFEDFDLALLKKILTVVNAV